MRDFAGRVAVVTGAASGMGRAFAERFAAEGMRVVLADVESGALDETVRELRQQERDVVGVLTDVSDAGAVERLRDEALEAFGAIHLVCNNAGVLAESDLGRGAAGARRPPMWEQDLDDWRWTLGVNLWGVINGMRTFVPVLLEQDQGHIVNTASVAGLVTGAGLGIYTTTKHGVVALSEVLHRQLRGTSVGVSVLCPGGVRTRIGSASRNQPGREREIAPAPTEGQFTAAAMDPAEVARQVFEAARDDRFYILTHGDQYDGAIRARLEAILERRDPNGESF